VHRAGDPKLVQAAMCDLGVHQALRDDADYLTAGGERRVCHLRHQPDVGAAVDDAQAAPGKLRAECGGPGGHPGSSR